MVLNVTNYNLFGVKKMQNKHIFLCYSITIILFTFCLGADDETMCPNQWKTSELRGEFVSILHLIEKQEIGQETGWRKFAKFLTFLTHEKRMQTVHDFCVKINQEKDTPKKRWFRKVKSSNYEECLDKIFWAGNAELIKLKRPNFFTGLIYNMYSENAKMFEGMLKPRDQLLAEIFYATLKPGRHGQVDTGVLMEIVMGRPKRELRAAISKYNRLFINRHNNSNEPQLLVELKNISRKLTNDSATKNIYDLLEARIDAIAREESPDALIKNIFKTCEDWKNWERLCCNEHHCANCGLNSYTEKDKPYVWADDRLVNRINKMNILLKELLVLSKQDSMLDKYFSQKFQENCKSFINYMHNPNKSKKHHHQQQLSPNAGSIKKTSWFERLKNVKTEANTETAFAEIVPRRKFGTIKEMLKIAGLLEPDSEYKYLAQKLKEANLTGKYQAVQRFVDIHVGVDMLKILEHYVGGVSGILKDSTIKNGRATTFNAMFTAAYLGIMNNTSSKCYRDVEHGALQRIGDGIKQKKVRFAKLEGGEPRPTLQSIGSKRPAPMEEEEIDIENSLVKSLEFLMSKVQSQINYLIKAQLEGLRPADRAKEMAVNCEVDDELFGQFLNGIEIGPNLLHRGGANCLQGIYDNLAERRSKIIFGEDGQLGILPPSAEPKLNLGPNAIKRNRTPKSGKLEIREPQHESNTSKNIVKSPKLIQMPPTKEGRNIMDNAHKSANMPTKDNAKTSEIIELEHQPNSPKPIQMPNSPTKEGRNSNDNAHKSDNMPTKNNATKSEIIELEHQPNSPKAIQMPNSPAKEERNSNDNAHKSDNMPKKDNATTSEIIKLEREPSLKSISKSPQKEENGNNESFNVIVALDDLINLFRKARDNLLLAEVELEVPHVAYNDNSACWVDDQLFKQFLNGEPIGQYLLPNGDANKMGTILNYLHDRRDYYAQYQPLDESRLMIRLNSLINRVDKAQKYLAKAEGPYYNPKARTKTRTNEFDNLFKQFLDGKKIGRKFLPKGGSNCMDSFLDNLIQRRENLKNGGDGLLGEQPVVEERHNGEKYGKTRSMPINGSLVPHHSKDIDYNKSHSMPTTEKEYKRTSSERSRSYGRPRDNEITSSVPAPADNESQNSESPPPSWLDTAREWSGWMKDKLNPFNTVNKAETVKKSLTNETITPQKITREISPKKNEKNINDEHFAKPKESPSKNNVVHVNASTGRNTNKISPPRDQPSTPGLAPNQRPKITVSPDTPIKSSPKSPKSPTESPLSANSDSSKTTTSSSTSDDDIQHQAQQLNIRARITAKTPYGSKKSAATNVPVKDVPESSRSRAVPTHSSDSALLRKNLQKNVPNFMKSKSLGHKNVQNNFARSPKSPTESPLGLMSSSSSATTSPKSPTERPFVGVINSSSSSATTTSSSGTSDDDVEHQAQQFNIRARITAKTPYGSKKSVGTNDAVKGVPKSSRSRAAPTRASKAELLGKNAERNVPNFTKSKSFGHKNTENKIGIRQAAPAKSDVAESSRSRAAPTRSSNPELLRKNAEKRNVPNLMKSKSFGHKNAPNTIGTTRQAAPAQSDSEDDVRLLSTGVRDLAGNFDLLNQGNITNNTMNHNHDVQLRPIVSRNGRKSSRARVSPRKLPTRPPPPPPAPRK